MSLRRKRGRIKILTFRKRDSVTISQNEVLITDTGRAGPAISATAEAIIGVSLDSYASDTLGEQVSVQVPTEQAVEWEIDVDASGGLVASDVLTFRDLDTLGANLDRATSTDDVLFVTGRISATLGEVSLAKTVWNSPSHSLFVSS